MAASIFHRLIMGKVEMDIFSALTCVFEVCVTEMFNEQSASFSITFFSPK